MRPRFVPLALLLASSAAAQLYPARSFHVGEGSADVAYADLNGDGWLDLVSANHNHDGAAILLGVGKGPAMHLALGLSLAALPLAGQPAGPAHEWPGATQDEVCAELRPILPDLRRIDRWDAHGRRHLVTDARVHELEDRLEEYLGIPPELRVKLTTISGHRREVAKNGSITTWIHHRETGLGLGHAILAWDGESVDVSGLRFRTSEAPRAFTKADLPVFYRRLGELLEIVDPAEYPIEGMSFFSGSPSGDSPGFLATVAIRVPSELGEIYLSVPANLPLDESVRPHAGPADRPIDVRRALDVGLELVAELEFDFPHSMQLRSLRSEPVAFDLGLDPYVKGQQPLPVYVRFRRTDDDTGWTVTDTWLDGDSRSIELGAFVALVNRVQGLLVQSGLRCGVLGLAPGEAPEIARALLVTVDAESIWAAASGRVHVLSVNAEGEATVVERSELGDIRAGEPAGNVREAVSSTGELFHLFVPVRGDIFMSNPPPRVLRYGTQGFVPVGGRLSD